MTNNIAQAFNQYFEMIPAQSQELKETTYRLRFQVYTMETGHLNVKDFPNGMEIDEYDDQSEHFLIRHKESGLYVATTRLILPLKSDPDRQFSVEKHSLIENPDLLAGIPRIRIAEVSRFCVSQQFKRRAGELNSLAGISDDILAHVQAHTNQRSALPNFVLPLIACLIRMSMHHEITHWYAFMEPALARMLRGFGINSVPIGPLVDFYGKRRPYLIVIAELLQGVKEHDESIWNLLTNFGHFWPKPHNSFD